MVLPLTNFTFDKFELLDNPGSIPDFCITSMPKFTEHFPYDDPTVKAGVCQAKTQLLIVTARVGLIKIHTEAPAVSHLPAVLVMGFRKIDNGMYFGRSDVES